VNLAGSIDPGHRWPHGRFGLADHNGQSVDQQDDVKAFFQLANFVSPLVANDQFVVGRNVEVDQPHGGVFAAIAKWHRLVVPHPLGKRFVTTNQTVVLNGQRNGP